MNCTCSHEKAEHEVGADWVTREKCGRKGCTCKLFIEGEPGTIYLPSTPLPGTAADKQMKVQAKGRMTKAKAPPAHYVEIEEESNIDQIVKERLAAKEAAKAKIFAGDDDYYARLYASRPRPDGLVPRQLLTESEKERGVRSLHELGFHRQEEVKKELKKR